MNDLINNIKNLREISGAGFLDCKKALQENNNNIEKSIDYLRKKGLSKATKKSSRSANEGAVGFYSNNNKTVILEINTETDFSAKNEIFLNFFDKIGNYILNSNLENNISIENIMSKSFEGNKLSDYFVDIISKIVQNL